MNMPSCLEMCVNRHWCLCGVSEVVEVYLDVLKCTSGAAGTSRVTRARVPDGACANAVNFYILGLGFAVAPVLHTGVGFRR